jgi:hypothetical protein
MGKLTVENIRLLFSPLTGTLYIAKCYANGRVVEKRPINDEEEKLILNYVHALDKED